MFRDESSRYSRLMRFEIGSKIFPSNWFSPRDKYTSLDEKEELGTSI